MQPLRWLWPALPFAEQQLDRAVRLLRAAALAAYTPQLADAAAAHFYRGWGASRASAAELFPFEGRALKAFFPAPPASLFLPGCGPGREVVALSALGYRVRAMDPEAKSTRLANGRTPSEVALGSVQEWARSGSVERFDAVFTGWGMWTHLTEQTDRVQVLEAFRRACDGPVLLSFWRGEAVLSTGTQRGTASEDVFANAARRLRQRVGRPLPKTLTYHRGLYAYLATEAELQREAHVAGYTLAYYERDGSTYPHAVLRPS